MTIARTAFLLCAVCLISFGQAPRLTPRVNNQHPILAIGSAAYWASK